MGRFRLEGIHPSLVRSVCIMDEVEHGTLPSTELVHLTICLICSLGSLHLIGFNAFRTIHQGRPETYYENERFTSADNAKLAISGESQFYAQDYENTFFWKYLVK